MDDKEGQPIFTIEQTAAAESLKDFDTNVHLATPKAIQDVLVPGQLPQVIYGWRPTYRADDADSEFHPIGPTSKLSTPDNPAIIYDGGASDCTILFNVAPDGSVLSFHDSLHAYKEEVRAKKLNDLQGEVKTRLGDNSLLIITGMNMQFADDLGKAKDWLVGKIKAGLSDFDIRLLLTRQSESQTEYSQLPQEVQKIYGLVYVPKQFTQTDNNELFVITDKSDERGIRDFLGVKG